MESWFAGVYPEWIEDGIAGTIDAAIPRANLETQFPTIGDSFAAFRWLHPDEVAVVVIGQDPYPGRPDACGIMFQSVDRITRSAASIYDNLVHHGHMTSEQRSELTRADFRGWLLQGVLLVNVVPVVTANKQQDALWHGITRRMLAKLPINSVALLLGGAASCFAPSLPCARIVVHTHPIRPSADEFRKLDCFGVVNSSLRSLGLDPVDWSTTGV
jgi:uracil-DNA glycosylase